MTEHDAPQPTTTRPDGLPLTRLGDDDEAGLILTSLPLPRNTSTDWSLDDRPTWTAPLGQWFDAPTPRRLLMAADGGCTPERIAMSGSTTQPMTAPPQVEMVLIERSPDEALMWERHELSLNWQGRRLGLALGLRVGATVHWWENCALDVLQETPQCVVAEMGGAIAHEKETRAHRSGPSFFDNTLLHRHNWVNGHMLVRLHANGVCEVFAHHINSRFFDDGLDLADAVPVIGLRTDTDSSPEVADLLGPWDGSQHALRLGDVRFDVRDAARLATPEQPGSISHEAGFVVWQPYMGMELYGGAPTEHRTGTPYVCRAEERTIPRGMARTIRFSLSLNPERSPTIARYVAPGWWYGHCEELSPRPLLPVTNDYDITLDACVTWCGDFIHTGGFEDGSLPRSASASTAKPEPGWEGEIPYTLFLQAWRTGDAGVHELAMRSAYQYTDVAIDHAAKMTRMHAYPPPAFSVPMNRTQACVAAWLETGDTYLLNTARAVTEQAWWTHLNSWPRVVVGRDASFVRSAVYLYRYIADRHFLDMAQQCARHVALTQRPDGSFGDQGGGVGIHGEGAYITKPWMGFMACGGLIDLLELDLGTPQIRDTVHRFAQWLRQEQYEHEDGVRGWDYQHAFDGKPRAFSFGNETWGELKKGGRGVWAIDYLARFLMFSSLDLDDPWYFDAWVETWKTAPENRGSDHAAAQSLQYVTWVQDRLWNATLADDGQLSVEPLWLGPSTPAQGTIDTPSGPLQLRWQGDQIDKGGASVRVQPRNVGA